MRSVVCLILGILSVSSFVYGNPAQSAKEIRDQLGEFMGIYLTVPDRRHAKERVLISGNRKSGYVADIWVWRSMASRNAMEEKCNAFTWLLLGRTQYGKGASQAFDQFDGLTGINLRFFDVETGTKLGKKKGEILPTEKIVPYAWVGVKKASLKRKKWNPESLAKQLSGNQCVSIGARYVDKNWFNEPFMGSKK